MANVTASFTFHGTQYIGVPVVNPGDWFGKCWLLEIGGSYWPIYLIVEADSVSDAIDVLADDEKYGHHIVVEDADLGDYPEDERTFGPSGQVIDAQHLMIYGQDGAACPFPCVYHGDGLPAEGMTPTDYYRREEADE